MSSSAPSVDLGIFQNKDVPPSESHPYKECIAIKRLSVALSYYLSLNVASNLDDQHIFINFMNENYKQQIIDDHHHLQKYHDNELEEVLQHIKDQPHFSECNIDNCSYSDRHYRVKSMDYDQDHHLHFYMDAMDSLHFYLYHVHEIGMRSSKKETATNDDEKHVENEYFDGEFSRKHKIISQKRSISRRFDRISNKSTKFNMKIDDDYTNNDNESMTSLDSIFEQLSNQYEIEDESIENLQNFMRNEKFDTESMEYDIYYEKGNLSTVTTPKCINALIAMFDESHLSKGSFSVGMEFEYYWKTESFAKYSNFKDEILNYGYIGVKTYEKEIKYKAQQYVQSNIAKSMTDWDDKQITSEHLLSVILYTDLTELSSDFTTTFRRKYPFETKQQVQKRNGIYWYWSKWLTETVLRYGQRRYKGLRGPFYTGMGVVMNMEQFSICLISPTSTSVHIEVAMKFAGESGIIIQFDNPEGTSHETKCIDCSWISRYKEEDERLFFQNNGRNQSLMISSIRIIETSMNFEKIITAISAFDAVISAQLLFGLELGEDSKTGEVIRKLIEDNLGAITTINQYIRSTFHCFVQNKMEIKLRMDVLDDDVKDKSLLDLILFRKEKLEWKYGEYRFEKREDTDNTNLPNYRLFQVFTNVKSVHLMMTDYDDGTSCYTFSALALLQIIKGSSIEKVVIEMKKGKEEDSRSWLSFLWEACSEDLINKYKDHGFDIEFEQPYYDEIHINKV